MSAFPRWYDSAMATSLKILLVILPLVVANGFLESEDGHQPTVSTRYGAVRGRYQSSSMGRPILAFYNLPFAKPPVGVLRFRDPQPPGQWYNIRNATSPGPDCIQLDDYYLNTGVFGSEDCLYLNVFTPQLSQTKLLPVMFWVFGGGFTNGGATGYGPYLLLDHDVVLVTCNYRLGPFGFLSTEDEVAPGNFGLKDQLAALRWVKGNIAAFGGDPNLVTVFGESVGAGSAHFLALSPLSRGLFQRVIMESGTALAVWAVARRGIGARNSRSLANLLGCPTDSSAHMVDCLRTVDPYEILDGQTHLKQWDAFPTIRFQPVVEGEVDGSFLPQHPLHLKPDKMDWIIGVNNNDGSLITGRLYGNSLLWKDFTQNFNRLFPVTAFIEDVPFYNFFTTKIQNFYFPFRRFSIGEMTDLYSDLFFNWNADEAVRLYRNVSNVYYYTFSYRGKYRTADPFRRTDFDFGAGHTDELFYLFPKNPFYQENYTLSEEDMRLARTMTKLWTNFAITGNPTSDDDSLHWPNVSFDEELEYLDIGKELVVKKGLTQRRIQFWRSLPPFRE